MSKLDSSDPEERWQAIWELGDYGPENLTPMAVAGLKRACADSVPENRRYALSVLVRAKLDEAIARELFVAALHDAHADVRISSMAHIGEQASVRDSGWIVQELVELLGDEDDNVVEAAIRGLGILPSGAYVRAYGRSDRPLLECVTEANTGDRQRRIRAILALESFGPTAIGPLQVLASDPDPIVRRAVLVVLAGIGSEALPVVLEALNDSDRSVRASSVQAIGRCKALSILTRLLQHSDAVIRWMAADCLGSLGPEAASAVPELIAMLRRHDEPVGYKAALTLRAIGFVTDDAVAALVQTLQAPDPTLREAAAYALGSMGPRAVAALIPLLRAKYASGDIAISAADISFLRICDESATAEPSATVMALMEGLKDENCDVRRVVVAYLADRRFQAHVPLETFITACHDTDPHVSYEAVSILGEFGAVAASATGTLADLVQNDKSDLDWLNVRRSAAFALGRIGSGAVASVPALRAAVNATEPQLRYAAAWALAQIDPTITDGLAILVDKLRTGDSLERTQASDCLARLGPAASQAIPVLESLLTDEVVAVREAAESALRSISVTITRRTS